MTDGTDNGELMLSILRDIQGTLADHTRQFEAIDQRFEAVDRRFEAIDRRFDAIDRRFDGVERDLTKLWYSVRRIELERIGREDDILDLRDRVRKLEEHVGLRPPIS